MDEDTLLRELARSWRNDVANPLLTQEQVQQAEARLGFALPSLLRRFYSEVGNGHCQFLAEGNRRIIGPYLYPLTLPDESIHQWDKESVVAWYRCRRDERIPEEEQVRSAAQGNPYPIWPERMLQIADWGCNMYSCVDCAKLRLPVFRNDNNISFATFAVETPSLSEWLECWLKGDDPFAQGWERAEKLTFV